MSALMLGCRCMPAHNCAVPSYSGIRPRRDGCTRQGDVSLALTTPGARVIRPGRPGRLLDTRAAAEPPQIKTDQRIIDVETLDDLQNQLDSCGGRLVVLELMAEAECSSGLFEAEDHWTPMSEQHRKSMEMCTGIRHSFATMAMDSPDTLFLSCTQDGTPGPKAIAAHLGISMFPAVVFFRNKKVVWQTQGYDGMQSDVTEGLIYFGGKKMSKSNVEPCVDELSSCDAVDEFVAKESPAKLKMLMVSTPMCSPCIHVYPSFVTLAMNFGDMIKFGRIEGDDEELAPMLEKLKILEVPTFISFKDGVEVDRLVSGNRGDLVGHLLGLSIKSGMAPPRPK